jgi:pyroglutamyl-peptidase
MTRVLLTAFGPYGRWKENSSWQALVELTRELPESPRVTTRLYPVDSHRMREKLREDLAGGHDFAIHLGQAPGASAIRLESFALNVEGDPARCDEELPVLVDGAPPAYQVELPVHQWARRIRDSGVPTVVSYHAGIYLCNATLYYSCHYCRQEGFPTKSAFIHLPLMPSQILHHAEEIPSTPVPLMASALRQILATLAN